MKRLLWWVLAVVVMAGCAGSYWVKVQPAQDVKAYLIVPQPCGNPQGASCWQPSTKTVQVMERSGSSDEILCLAGHGKKKADGFGHDGDGESYKRFPESGLTNKQWPFNGRYDCGDYSYGKGPVALSQMLRGAAAADYLAKARVDWLKDIEARQSTVR